MKIFKVNGIDTKSSVFGYGFDEDPSNAPEFGCGNRSWCNYDYEDSIVDCKEEMENLHITKEDYYEICKILEENLNWGYCYLCQ